MRAARCIAELHAEEAQVDLEAWVTDPALTGLRIQTLKLLPTLPVAVAQSVAAKAVAANPSEVTFDELAARDPRLTRPSEATP
jgi:hypothetical protein